MRIDKMLSQLNYGSRQEIKKMAKKGFIFCNQKRVDDVSMHIDPERDEIMVNQEVVFYKNTFLLKIYKPVGYECSHKQVLYPSVIDLIKEPYQRFDLNIAGRLDVDAEGLVLITNDGALQHQITHPKKHLVKHYEVTLDRPFKHEEALLAGVSIKDGHNQPYIAKALSVKTEDTYVKITIDEGKFHQVKRMFEAVGYKVTHLKRTQIGNITLEDLKPGAYQMVLLEDLK
ncbi:MAG: pseudouridine synthase [Acholeplasmataceae bacterium]